MSRPLFSWEHSTASMSIRGSRRQQRQWLKWSTDGQVDTRIGRHGFPSDRGTPSQTEAESIEVRTVLGARGEDPKWRCAVLEAVVVLFVQVQMGKRSAVLRGALPGSTIN